VVPGGWAQGTIKGETNHILPFLQGELDRNPQLDQNDGFLIKYHNKY
jgi:hypothetical protein